MQPQDSYIEPRLRTLRVLWFALLLSVVMYFIFTLFAMERAEPPGNRSVSFIFMAIAVISVILSFVLKQKLLQRSVEQQDIKMVQPAFVVAWAMCEVSALLGVVEYVVVGRNDYIVLFLLGAGGLLFHFPSRQPLLNASYKKLIN